MKLIPLIFFISITVEVITTEHYNFPPKFHPHNSGVMSSSDSSIYLPPETHTSMQYLPIKNENKLPYPYLPMTGTKAPLLFPTPFPMMLSSTITPMAHDDEDEDTTDDKPPSQYTRNNRTTRSQSNEMDRNNFKPTSNNYQAIDRMDKKIPYGFISSNPSMHTGPSVQKATPRSMIITEQQRNDIFDQFKAAAAYQGPSYLPAPGTPGVYISSTTETAVPIIRLSNEMDLDGSFSYEALGADQTHYVQHSRMENTGTDKEEQVVEGSYSYVGDNGQTYTVHYIADSKGFRASGDHLPVAPPIPEIIQRAVQFNLAEEAKKPPNLKSWQSDEKENELSESERYQRYIAPPIRPLFTGKAPQSFSFGFGQGAPSSQNTDPRAVVNSQAPINSNNDFKLEQIKPPNTNIANNGGPISPQITFLASQGAHIPSVSAQQPIARSFTTERPTLPQLLNYDAAAKESNEESNKALWRWQYGLNTNMNQTPEKNSISRSSGEGDNVIINFSDMTPEQYSKMIRTELEPKVQNTPSDQVAESNSMNSYQAPMDNNNFKIQNDAPNEIVMSTESNFVSPQIVDRYKQDTLYHSDSFNHADNLGSKSTDMISNSRSKLLTQKDFLPHSQTVTQSYDYEDISYEPRRIIKSSTKAPESYATTYQNTFNNNYESRPQNSEWLNVYGDQVESIQKISTTDIPKVTTERNISFSDFIVHEDKNEFKPMQPSYTEVAQEEQTNSTEASFEDVINENIFLKNLFKTKKNDQYDGNRIREDNNKNHLQKLYTEHMPEKKPKFIQMQAKAQNDYKSIKKPMEIGDILNYLSAKNNFESIKVKPKSKYAPSNYNHRNEVRYIPMQNEHLLVNDNGDEEEHLEVNTSNHRTNYYHPKELQGIIKNYKVLQRNNSAFNSGHDAEQLRRNLSPSSAKISNLPPLGRAGPSMKSYLPPVYV